MDPTVERSATLIGAWVPRELAERLEAVAEATDRSRSAELRIALRAHLEAAADDEGDTSA